MSEPAAEKRHVWADRVGMTFPGGHVAIGNASFSVRQGEFVAVVGPSGCGKSTLLRLIAGLIAPTRGRLTVDDAPAGAAARRGRVGFVFQDPRLLPWRSAAENVRLPLELEGIARSEQSARIGEALSLVGLAPRDAEKTPRMLSGGMRMRVSLARALVTRPELLLLDEPFAALDDISRQQLNEELSRIWARQGWTAVFVTHNVAEAVALSQRVLIASASPGRIVAELNVPFDYPRTSDLRATGPFARLTGEVGERLREGAR